MSELKLITMDSVQVKEIDWLWYPYIPMGKITIIEWDPGQGKTSLVLKIAAILSNGGILMGDTEKRDAINIIYQTAEDGLSDTIKPRLIKENADCNKIYIIDESKTPLSMNDSRLEEAIIKTKAQLIILDPIQAYIGANVDMHRANEVRPIFKKLSEIAEKYNCAVILIGHMNKASMSKSTYRGLGTIDIQAAARSVLIVGRMRENPETRIMVQDKNSLAKEGRAVAFNIDEESGVDIIGETDITVDELLQGYSSNKINVKKFIEDELSNGEVNADVILRNAKEQGISERTLKNYKKQMNIKSYKRKNGWIWKKAEI